MKGVHTTTAIKSPQYAVSDFYITIKKKINWHFDYQYAADALIMYSMYVYVCPYPCLPVLSRCTCMFHMFILQLREKREEIFSMRTVVFSGVFVHRYRDKLSEIRVICIEELGVWLKLDPEHFLNDKCLKYLGWTLHDKVSNPYSVWWCMRHWGVILLNPSAKMGMKRRSIFFSHNKKDHCNKPPLLWFLSVCCCIFFWSCSEVQCVCSVYVRCRVCTRRRNSLAA